MSLLCQVSHNDPNAIQRLGKAIRARIRENSPFYYLVFLCIGTDRCTGDALGPLVGMFLEEAKLQSCLVWGTLESPVHALNLQKTIDQLQTLSSPLVISIDACLGLTNHIGDVQIVNGPLKPGLGVKKVLPAVGDFHIKGIVNASGFLESMVLQNTRLNIVMSLAKIISEAIIYAVNGKPGV
ncbi:MAG TPA: spore protease YyaC [Bacillota bacterium]|nr:spore protease YyaC [Bacillota bacterium]